MSWKSFVFPQTLSRYTSRYNTDIRIVEEAGKLKLLVNGSPQSGRYIRSLWQRVLPGVLGVSNADKPDVLVLGVGGGTVIGMIADRLPGARITAVDIDPVIIRISRTYFRIDTVPGLKIVEDDAVDFMTRAVARGITYDLVVADLFIGRHIPEFVGSGDFLRNLKKSIAPGGFLVINYLREREYGRKSDLLLDKLQKLFHSVKEKKIFLNRFFISQN